MSTPILDHRGQAAVLSELRQDLPGYTKEWSPNSTSPGLALMYIFARYAGILIDGVNRVPERSLLAFLDMLGTHLLPAQAARAPLVFSLADKSPLDVNLPADSQVAASSPPTIPAGVTGSAAKSAPPTPLIFATDETITLSRGHLATLYSIVPGSDAYCDHSASLTSGLSFFDNLIQTEHAIYLGHDTLFDLSGAISVFIAFGLRTPADIPLTLAWEYLTDNGWLVLESAEEDDTTDGLMRDGSITLSRAYGPSAKEETFAGQTSYWIRGRLTTPLLPDGTGGKITVPVINRIRARLDVSKFDLLPEAAFADFASLDPTKNFYPFGQQPGRYSAFYVASTEVFQRQNANVQLNFVLSQPGQLQPSFRLTWEYFDGANWVPLTIVPAPNISSAFNFDSYVGTVTFVCPGGWQPTTVNGVKNYWLRVCIRSGSFGYPIRLLPTTQIKTNTDLTTITVQSVNSYATGDFVLLLDASGKNANTIVISDIKDATGTIKLGSPLPSTNYAFGTIGPPQSPFGQPVVTPSSLQAPVVHKLTLQYRYLTDPETPNHCLSKNDFVFEDHTNVVAFPDQTFTPFHPVADVLPAIHFGFDQPLPIGLISLFVDIPDTVIQNASASPSPYQWEYLSPSGWNELGILDDTSAFTSRGMIQFIGPQDAIAADGLGGELYWIRARLKQGLEPVSTPLSGIWLNATWATQRNSTSNESLGASDGNPGQTLLTRYSPVLAGEVIEVQEWTGNGEGWRSALQDVPISDMRFDRDPATNAVVGVWVCWHEQTDLYSSLPTSRHYIIERATGTIRFGPPGLIPPAGSSISAQYDYGGGVAGNVPAGSISEMHTAVPYLLSVTNPVPATGGADTETMVSVEARGPQRIRTQDRAVAPADYDWLAREASPEVARVRCIPITGPDGHAQRGWVTLAVVPRSSDPQPQPTPEFELRILSYLSARVPPSVMSKIRIEGPQYVPVAVHAEVVPAQADQAAQLEASIRDRLNQFLHPIRGGPQGSGWNFAQPVYLSQIASVIEDTNGVDHAVEIVLQVNGQVFADYVPVTGLNLIAAGKHEIKLTLPLN